MTFPTLRTALVAGALLAFALSLDEIIVTTFTIGQEQTLPIWIFTNYARPNQLPIVNVVGLLVIILSIIPVYFANRLSQDPIGAPGGRSAGAAARRSGGGARGLHGGRTALRGGPDGADYRIVRAVLLRPLIQDSRLSSPSPLPFADRGAPDAGTGLTPCYTLT